MNDKFLDLTDEQKEDIGASIDNEGFYYALKEGMVKPEDFIKDKSLLVSVKESISNLKQLEHEMEKEGLIF